MTSVTALRKSILTSERGFAAGACVASMFNLFESMFFRGRSAQAEYFNTLGVSEAERAGAFRELDKNAVNSWRLSTLARAPACSRKSCRLGRSSGAGTGVLPTSMPIQSI